MKAVLCIIPIRGFHSIEEALLRDEIKKANAIIRMLLDTALIASKEPSFRISSWSSTVQLLGQIVDMRIRRAAKFQRRTGLSDDTMYDSVWKDRLKLVIEVQDMRLQPDWNAFPLSPDGGVLGYGYWLQCERPASEEPLSPSSYRFLDDLARGRDALWRNVRLKKHPLVATLPAPYSRGRDIQDLLGMYNVGLENLEEVAPRLASRAKAAVFI